eukprot:6198773-Pleurochrysis_carterae.AAC.2
MQTISSFESIACCNRSLLFAQSQVSVFQLLPTAKFRQTMHKDACDNAGYSYQLHDRAKREHVSARQKHRWVVRCRRLLHYAQARIIRLTTQIMVIQKFGNQAHRSEGDGFVGSGDFEARIRVKMALAIRCAKARRRLRDRFTCSVSGPQGFPTKQEAGRASCEGLIELDGAPDVFSCLTADTPSRIVAPSQDTLDAPSTDLDSEMVSLLARPSLSTIF